MFNLVHQFRGLKMSSIAKFTTAGVLTAALGLAPLAAQAQTQGTGSTTSQPQTTSTSQPQTTSPEPMQQSQAKTGNEEVVRQHLAAARQSLAELTKLPAAAQLQGDQRTAISSFISEFNAFATAGSEWRSKYIAVDQSLNRLLAGSFGPSTGEAATASSTVGTSGTSATTEGQGGLDPTITAKLQELRTHLDAFEEASADPLFILEDLEKALNDAVGLSDAQASTTVAQGVATSGTGGTPTGTSSQASAGPVTIDQAKLSEIRRHVQRLKESLQR